MWRKILLITGFAVICLYCNANLLENGDFNLSPYGHVSARQGTYKLSVDKYGNDDKCVRLEIMDYDRKADHKNTNVAFFIGNDKNRLGFPVEPGTCYKFSLILKGNQAKTIVRAEEIDSAGGSLWTDKRTRLKADFSIPVKVEPGKWNKVEGTFTTSSQAKRACLVVQFWWNEKYGPTMYKKGDYVLIDKAIVEKAPDKLSVFALSGESNVKKTMLPREKVVQVNQQAEIPVIDGKLDDACWKKLLWQSNFTALGGKVPARVKSEFKIFRDSTNIYIGVKCFEPDMGKLKASVSENGLGIWKDDVIEVFFAPAFESSFLQFAVCAGGGRYIGDGNKELDSLYDRWEAEVGKGKDYWTLEFKIPYKLMWNTINENNLDYRLNVCRQRRLARELSSWSPVNGSFHKVNEFGRMFFGDVRAWSKAEITRLQGEISSLSDSSKKALETSIGKLDFADIGTLFNQLNAIREQIKFLKVAGRKFVVTEVAGHRAPRLPLLPEQLSNPPAEITLTAAVNEICSIPLAVTNLTDSTAEYQVLLCSGKINRADEKPGLKSVSGRFSADKITCLRAIRVKESDEAGTSVRFDPLVEIDKSSTVTASSKDSALFYYKFDCRGAAPGVYKGFLHVIPLSEPTLAGRSVTSLPQIQSIPFTLTILPIELSTRLRAPLWYFGNAQDKKFVERMLNEGITYFPVSLWGVRPQFDDKGNITVKDISIILEHIARQRRWVAEHSPDVKPKHVAIYSMYYIFMQRFGKNRFKVGTPEWRNAYKNWVRLIDEARRKAGLSSSDFIVEVEDEPAHTKASPPLEVILEAAKMTKEVAPELKTMLTFSSHMKAEELYQFIPYVDVWNFWEGLLSKKGFPELVEKLRGDNKQIWIYRCNTGINSDLYSYYRLHAWRGELRKVDVVSLWTAYGAPTGFPSAWRNAINGNYLMLYGDSFSTVRNESFLTGFNDLKYYDKLEKIVQQAKAQGKDPALIRKAEALLKESPEKIIRNSNDFRMAEQFRKEAVDYILKLQK